MRECQLQTAEKFWPIEGQKVEKRYLYPLSLATKNDDKKQKLADALKQNLKKRKEFKKKLENK